MTKFETAGTYARAALECDALGDHAGAADAYEQAVGLCISTRSAREYQAAADAQRRLAQAKAGTEADTATTGNPIPFNPVTMKVSELMDTAETLRTLFQSALNGVDEATLSLDVHGALRHWQKKTR